MKNCPKCNFENWDDAAVCTGCGHRFDAGENGGEQSSKNWKLYSIFSYISIFWLLGMLIPPDKFDPRVRFHVGQGIIASIVNAAIGFILSGVAFILGLIFGIITANASSTALSVICGLIIWLVILAGCALTLILPIIGIINVCKNKQEKLPLVGKFAFYK